MIIKIKGINFGIQVKIHPGAIPNSKNPQKRIQIEPKLGIRLGTSQV